MHIVYLRLTLFIFFICHATVQASPIKDEGQGRVYVNGQILTSACNIHTEDVWQEFVFDSLSPHILENNNGLNEKRFSIRLVNCDLRDEDKWRSIAFTLSGEAVSHAPSLFSLRGEAKGIALKVTDSDGEQALPGIPMHRVVLSQNEHQFDYVMQVVPDGKVFIEGDWAGAIRFTLSYQ
ncbi:PAP fimbrial minor pilin protein [Pantoea ananatis]|uniref:fimbrial protein n=1 Tax=Pantoea ananas TaxID=553 RepID=UPI0021E7DA09|nr:fimbrial protein [Pantoea ananatis]MCW0306315.1 PAP fimbrial minor pilin protein [Pantoea ananatis]MCW0338019.1 PAP fimbrial minor pilin protein [Pantoea ananatis]MCW0356186.1 PAP fimbrial minor pilin protein [Pantoea ananatis]MCW0360672.1 PAP fimbrial minor pilin protein [Pantoea ananatis]MCW1773255.1 type 1 fimbrial protein [Pantoea ananatis]